MISLLHYLLYFLFLMFIKYCETAKNIFLYLSSFLCLLAMFSKETGILVPFIIIFYFVLFEIYLGNFKVKHILEKIKDYRIKHLKVFFIAFTIPTIIYFVCRLIISSIKVKEGD